jgi:hypothetical protein
LLKKLKLYKNGRDFVDCGDVVEYTPTTPFFNIFSVEMAAHIVDSHKVVGAFSH